MSNSDDAGSDFPSQTQTSDEVKKYLQLMEQDSDHAEGSFDASSIHDTLSHELTTTPLFSHSVRQHLVDGNSNSANTDMSEPFLEYGLLGMGLQQNYNGHELLLLSDEAQFAPQKDFIFTHMNAPWSAFICGSQGAGKSHTLSCLLENALLTSSPNGTLSHPMTGIIFHYDKFSGFTQSQLCEAAYLSSKVQDVRVLVAPTSEFRMRRLYGNLPEMPDGSSKPSVTPLYFQERHIDLSNLIQLMAIDEKKQGGPLYLEVVFDILRNMVKRNQNRQGINFREFESALLAQEFSREQRSFLNMRMNLLRSFLDPRVTGDQSVIPPDFDKTWTFSPGSLTIVDLSDPFVTASDACALFSICLSIFMANCHRSAKVIALDEAHKFLTQSGEASKFTEDLLQVIRQQRHLGARVIIATQEPTLSPKLLELSSMSIVHRFTSPAWLNVLKEHLAGAGASNGKHQNLFNEIVDLATGEALVFCPNALIDVVDNTIVPLKDGFMKVKIRKRITADGGKSIMASDVLGREMDLLTLAEQTSCSSEASTHGSYASALETLKLDSARYNPDQLLSLRPSSTNEILADAHSSSSSTLEGLSEHSDSAGRQPGAVNQSGADATHCPSVASHPEIPTPKAKPIPPQKPSDPKKTISAIGPGTTTKKASPVPPQQPSKVKKSKPTNAPVPEPTKDQLYSAFFKTVSASLSEDPNYFDPGCHYPQWRQECAQRLQLPKDYFSLKANKKESKKLVRRTMIDFYKSKNIKPPVIPSEPWLQEG